MYSKTTRGIKVIAIPTYLPDQSDPAGNHYVWAYTIQLTNLGGRSVQLLDRHWRITNVLGQMQEVRGAGVVGQQPVIPPEGQFQYSSGAALTTPSGLMAGSYGMVDTDSGERFAIDIPAFSLDSPYEAARLN